MTHMLCWSWAMCFSAAASSENDHGSMNFDSKTAPVPSTMPSNVAAKKRLTGCSTRRWTAVTTWPVLRNQSRLSPRSRHQAARANSERSSGSARRAAPPKAEKRGFSLPMMIRASRAADEATPGCDAIFDTNPCSASTLSLEPKPACSTRLRVWVATLQRIEQNEDVLKGNFSTILKTQRALEEAGIHFTEDGAGGLASRSKQRPDDRVTVVQLRSRPRDDRSRLCVLRRIRAATSITYDDWGTRGR